MKDPMDIIQGRDKVIRIICEEKGWDLSSLSFEQILEIRKDKRWVEANPNASV